MTRKLLTLFALVLCGLVSVVPAQTRRQTTSPARPTPRPQAAQPAATPTPQTPAPAPATGEEDCGCDAGPLPEVLAVVNGVRLTRTDLSAETEQRVRELRQQVIEARKRELDLQINSKLLDAEAKKRGVTAAKLLEQEVVAKAAAPTDADAQAFYEQNKARLQGEFKDLKDDIIGYLTQQRQQEQAAQFAGRLRAAAQVQVLTPEATPARTPAERARVLANVNGQPITAGDIEDSLRPLVAQVQQQVYQLRQHDVDTRINDTLLQQEAQKRQVTPQALLETEVRARVKPVTEAEAQAFYNQNKERINGDYARVKDQLVQYLTDERGQEATTAYADQLRRAATIQSFMQPPPVPVYDIATDDQPARGPATAKATIVEFTDFQCPSCAAQFPVLEQLVSEYGDRVRLVVRDFPLSQHKNAPKAAEAAEAAREQGKYWEYAALLFKMQGAEKTEAGKEAALAVPKLKEYATQLGLDRAKFDAALDSGRYAEKVQRDQLDGQKIGVNHTPSLYVNGRPLADNAYETIKTALDAALRGGK
ncbi:MAG TPA: thioredoxin domain-containing protein [Pyrinomonadaceae bacterium]